MFPLPYLAMEFLDGGSLRDLIEEESDLPHVPSADDALDAESAVDELVAHCRSSALCARSRHPWVNAPPSCTCRAAHRLRTEGDAVLTVHGGREFG
jgi:hypothetical protein